ncbi:MAG: hypothetical protein LBG52_05680 [Candidatus Peribacteria bacterium]|jgi:hypothetical protein|nr:hypothetical protein [Candidatus Peribacteria bacterium]
MRDLMKVGGYDPYFKYESHKPKPKQPEDYRDTQANDKYDKELKERNTEKVMFDKSMERLKS